MPTYRELKAQIAELERQAEEQRKLEIADARVQVQNLMKEYGLSADQLMDNGGKVRLPKPKTESVVRYRDPETGATWSGRGRAPLWIATAPDREKFAVGDAGAASTTQSATQAQQGSQAQHQAA